MNELLKLYDCCRLCPNDCKVNRNEGETGVCGETSRVKIAWCGLHRGEEPPITGKNGSGMIFFCGCSLKCRYCQNWQISCEGQCGVEVSVEELSCIMTELQKMGATTLNLVTGTHYIPSVLIALEKAKENGFNLPVVWNSSGYETPESLRLIDKAVDLYLLDVKTLNRRVAAEFCGFEKYVDYIEPAVRFLKRRHPETELENGLKGVLLRHLVFPGTLDATMEFLTWFADNFKDSFRLSLMVQFVPPKENPGFENIKENEYDLLLETLDKLGIDGFVQEPDSNDDVLWLPDFNRENPFPTRFADPLPYFLNLRKERLSQ